MARVWTTLVVQHCVMVAIMIALAVGDLGVSLEKVLGWLVVIPIAIICRALSSRRYANTDATEGTPKETKPAEGGGVIWTIIIVLLAVLLIGMIVTVVKGW